MDRSWGNVILRELERNGDEFSIIASITDLASKARRDNSVRGVETKEQLRSIRDAGCTQAQGYYFGRPVPEAEFRARLNGAEAARHIKPRQSA